MGIQSRAGILLFISVLLLALSALLVNTIDMSGEPLFYYVVNSLFVSFGVFGIPSCLFIFQNNTYDFGLRSTKASVMLLSFLSGIFAFIIGSILSLICSQLFDSSKSSVFLPEPSFFSILVVCIVPALTEEIFFRGILLFSWRSLGKRASIILTSLFFALMHSRPDSLPAMFFIGCVLGEAAFLSCSVLPSMIMHFSYNLTSLLLCGTLDIANLTLESFFKFLPILFLLMLFSISAFIFTRSKLLLLFEKEEVTVLSSKRNRKHFLFPLIASSVLLAAINVLTF
ncbi:MAG: CPBP family intramembrane metalloprotease [Clostridia bacterium]|nr:CPBP family intramembrane metalloprotease [Clostridia bacterium]